MQALHSSEKVALGPSTVVPAPSGNSFSPPFNYQATENYEGPTKHFRVNFSNAEKDIRVIVHLGGCLSCMHLTQI